MTYTYYNSRPDYYPVNFNTQSYQKNLDTLLSSKGTLGLEKHSFKRLSWIEKILNAVAWFFGFGDSTNVAKLNGEVLKFLHYGTTHNIINSNRKIQFQNLATQNWIALEVKEAINIVNQNDNADKQFQELRDTMKVYFSNNEQQLRPHFWKRYKSNPCVPINDTSPFGTTHYLKAAFTTDQSKTKSALNHAIWSLEPSKNDLGFQRKCFNLIQTLHGRSRSSAAEVKQEARRLFPYIHKLAKDCISQEKDFISAENFLEWSINHLGRDTSLLQLQRRIYFKQKKWEELTYYVDQFTEKFAKNEAKRNPNLKKLAEQAKGIAEIYQLCRCDFKVIEFLKKAIKYDPQDQTIPKRIGDFYVHLARETTSIEKAIGLLMEALKFDPDNHEIRQCIVTSYVHLARETTTTEKAIGLLMEALKFSDDNHEIRKKIAFRFRQKGDEIIQTNRSLAGMACNFLNLTAKQSPRMFYEQAYAFDPEFAGPHLQWLISEYESAKECSEAIRFYTKASSVHPNLKLSLSSNTCCIQASSYKAEGNFTGAYELLKLALKLDNKETIKEEFISIGFQLAKMLQTSSPSTAIRYYQEILPYLLQIKPNFIDPMLDIYGATFPISEKDVNDALSEIYYMQAIHYVDLCRHDETAYMDFKIFAEHCKKHQKDIKSATEHFQKALEYNPQSAKAHFDLANFIGYFEIEGLNADDHYKKAVELNPKNYFYKFRLAETDSLRGDKAAITALRRRIEKGLFTTTIHYPKGVFFKFIEWFDNRYCLKEDRTKVIDPHVMCS